MIILCCAEFLPRGTTKMVLSARAPTASLNTMFVLIINILVPLYFLAFQAAK